MLPLAFVDLCTPLNYFYVFVQMLYLLEKHAAFHFLTLILLCVAITAHQKVSVDSCIFYVTNKKGNFRYDCGSRVTPCSRNKQVKAVRVLAMGHYILGVTITTWN